MNDRDLTVTTVVGLIARYFPASTAGRITAVVGQEYDALSGSRLRGFIPNLVQHNARRRLDLESVKPG